MHLVILGFPMGGGNLDRDIFARFKIIREKSELSKCFWYPKRKLGVTMQFLEIIKLQFGKKTHTFLCYLLFF